MIFNEIFNRDFFLMLNPKKFIFFLSSYSFTNGIHLSGSIQKYILIFTIKIE